MALTSLPFEIRVNGTPDEFRNWRAGFRRQNYELLLLVRIQKDVHANLVICHVNTYTPCGVYVQSRTSHVAETTMNPLGDRLGNSQSAVAAMGFSARSFDDHHSWLVIKQTANRIRA